MKVAIIVLFALIAVSQAAFTKSLVQQAQPVVSQAIFRMRMSTTRSNGAIQNQLVESLENVVTNVLNQIEQATNTFETVVAAVSENVQGLYEQMVALGSEFAQSGSAIIQDFMQNIFGGLFGGNKSRLDVSGVLSFLQNLGLGSVDAILNQLASHINSLISSLDLQSLIHSAMSAVFGQQTADAIISAFTTKMGRGIWDSITSGLGSAWNWVSEGASNAWDFVSTSAVDAFNWVISNVPALAFEHIQAFAIEFVQNTAMQAAAAALPSVMGLVESLAPHAVALGDLYTQVMAIINSFSKGIKLIH